jgi:hypothetical protein
MFGIGEVMLDERLSSSADEGGSAPFFLPLAVFLGVFLGAAFLPFFPLDDNPSSDISPSEPFSLTEAIE